MKNYKKFNKEKAQNGAKVVTRDGREVINLVFDVTLINGDTIYGAVKSYDSPDFELTSWDQHGCYFSETESHTDIFMAVEKNDGWINIYKDFISSSDIYDSEEIANEAAGR